MDNIGYIAIWLPPGITLLGTVLTIVFSQIGRSKSDSKNHSYALEREISQLMVNVNSEVDAICEMIDTLSEESKSVSDQIRIFSDDGYFVSSCKKTWDALGGKFKHYLSCTRRSPDVREIYTSVEQMVGLIDEIAKRQMEYRDLFIDNPEWDGIALLRIKNRLLELRQVLPQTGVFRL